MTPGARPGPVALVGSGEFLPVMHDVDAGLLRGRPGRAVFLPTAAALEGDDRTAYWLELGRRHYEGMGVDPVPLDVRTRHDADDPANAALVEGAGLVYLSGGDPHHLASTLRATAVWRAVVLAWQAGAALAGCSAGAMALTAGAPDDLRPRGATTPPEAASPEAGRAGETPGPTTGANGLGVVGAMAVIPHYDQMERWRPGSLRWFSAWRPAGTTLVGIEEHTALVLDDGHWRIEGGGGVWVHDGDRRDRFAAGEVPPLPVALLDGTAP